MLEIVIAAAAALTVMGLLVFRNRGVLKAVQGAPVSRGREWATMPTPPGGFARRAVPVCRPRLVPPPPVGHGEAGETKACQSRR